MTTAFGIYQDGTDQRRRRLKSGGAQMIAIGGEAYAHRLRVPTGIDHLARNASDVAIHDVLA